MLFLNTNQGVSNSPAFWNLILFTQPKATLTWSRILFILLLLLLLFQTQETKRELINIQHFRVVNKLWPKEKRKEERRFVYFGHFIYLLFDSQNLRKSKQGNWLVNLFFACVHFCNSFKFKVGFKVLEFFCQIIKKSWRLEILFSPNSSRLSRLSLSHWKVQN